MMKNSCLIIGANGFVAKNLAPLIRAKGYEVVAVDKNNFALLRAHLRQHEPKFVFHLAGCSNKADWRELQSVFVDTTIELFSALSELKLNSRVIIPGSASEFGVLTENRALKEDDHARAASPYGLAKAWQVQLAQFYARQGLQTVVGRIFNMLGPDMPPATLMGDLQRKVADAAQGKTPAIAVGNLNIVRDFLHISDICSALWAIAEKGQQGDIYNICSAEPVVARTVLESMRDTAAPGVAITASDDSKGTNYNFGENKKLRALGWSPRFTIQDCIQEFHASINRP